MTAPQQQKLRVNGPVVVTANRLADGAVVYRASGGTWTTKLADAIVVESEDEAKRLLSSASGEGLHAVGAYVAPVMVEGRTISPGNLRERIRATGPTIALPADMKA